jgi:hypothetical protein
VKKAPDPQAYWLAQSARLLEQSPELFQEVRAFVFSPWDARSIAHQRQLGARLAALLGNEYNYAPGSFVSNIRKAIYKREREIRRGTSGIHNRRY